MLLAALGTAGNACAAHRTPPAFTIQDTTASLWSELGANSASNGGISQDFFGVNGEPAIAINAGNGDIYVAWPSADDEIHVRRWNGSAWTEVGNGSAAGGGVSNSPTQSSETPRLAVRRSDGHVFLAWREFAPDFSRSDVHVAEFDGSQWQRLGGNNGRVTDAGTDAHVRYALSPDIILSSVFSSIEMPIVAWNALTDFQGGNAIYVKRWTGTAWVEMGAGSASNYAWPGVFPDARTVTARGINADDAEVIRFYADGSSDLGGMFGGAYYHYSSCCARLLLDPLGKPAVVFLNGKSREGQIQYPYGLHVRRFIGDNSLPAYQAWEEVGRVHGGQLAGADASAGRDLSVAGLATGFSMHVATTVRDDNTNATSLQVLKFNGTGWSTLGTLDAGDNGGVDFFPSLALRRDGNLVLAWMHSTDSGSNFDIYARQSANIGGAFGWAELGGGSATGNGISNNPSLSGYPALALDTRSGNDVAVAAWEDGDTPDNDAAQTYVRRAQAVSATLPALSIANVSVLEGRSGARNATFTIGLSQPAGAGGVSFSMMTADARGAGNTALAGSDYASGGPLPVNIPFGETSATFSVKVFGDPRVEPDEAFHVRVTGLNGATLVNDTASGTILNDDVFPTQSTSPACQDLARLIADAETRAATGSLSEPRAIRRIMDAQSRRAQLVCR